MAFLWIAIGSALGGVARFWISGLVARRFGETFPWGTILVNITGCFLIGFINTLTDVNGRVAVHPCGRQFAMIGVLGGYTTFSSFSLQTLNLMRDGEWLFAAGNVMVSVVCCLAGVWLGHVCAHMLNR